MSSEFRKNLEVKVDNKKIDKLTEREARRTYEKFVGSQEEQFLMFINYLNKFINELRDQGIISPFLEFRARIKATNSALKNNQKKAIDDIFGIEFICATDREIEILQQEMEKMLSIYRKKTLDKENGYKAIHHLCSIKPELTDKLNDNAEKSGKTRKDNEEFPAIEIQYKTIEVSYQSTYGTASHEKYKDAKLPQLQALYDSDSLTVGEYIPYMWISDPNNDNMRELSTEEVLKKMYPSLILNKDRGLRAKENKEDEEEMFI